MKHTFIIVLIIVLFTNCRQQAEQITVASFNVRYHNSEDSIEGNGWQQRCPVVCDLIRFNNFQVFGAQEVLHDQLQDMLAGLPGYDYVGVGRDDGKTEGEYAPIFYQKEKFKVSQSGHFWLSDITDKPNKGWDAALPRICTWASLSDKETGFEFYFFNLHMDHVGVEARKNSAKQVLNKITEMCSDKPVILTGDFNVDQNSPNYAILEGSSLLKDSYKAAKVCYALNGTFNGFKTNQKTDSRIDHVFVSPEFTVERYGILTDTYRTITADSKPQPNDNFPKEVSLTKYESRLPSDHFPVKVVLRLSK
ncbi:endonuclease/exonuclease/phosphatase family protein [Plebeiibacterium sediminum]|uniref:Endonuclease/exonuclease/phosphatase family protein n=1 Tax=Plebeiibacterium sediminum TaxID=2992112 RepID=A0AAE3SES1_9BACT|nr:endonuclease/exonuclease/phosphatase family protein [Plebeiobacterium sediminum]MCW3786302.1 endonuclease/exonuclease/phosphatase family protein [Plebeiobacterium sediminum]